MDTRDNNLTGASIPPFAGGMDDEPVPDPPTLSAVPSPPRRTAVPVPGYGQYQVAAPVSMSAPRRRGSVRWCGFAPADPAQARQSTRTGGRHCGGRRRCSPR